MFAERLDDLYQTEVTVYRQKNEELEMQKRQHLRAAHQAVCGDAQSSGSGEFICVGDLSIWRASCSKSGYFLIG